VLDRASLQYGMPVRGAAGQHLGRVVVCRSSHFVLRRPPWFGRYHAVAYEDVASLRGGSVWLSRGQEALLPPELARGPLAMVLPLDPRASSVAEAITRA
jgi:hypothetical protein